MMGKSHLASFAAAVAMVASQSASADIIGWFDRLHVAMVDDAYGWVCDTSNPYTAPPGDIVIKANGSVRLTYPVANSWGGYRPDVPAAGLCSGNTNTGWHESGWIAVTNGSYEAFYRAPDGSEVKLGNTITCTSTPGDCP